MCNVLLVTCNSDDTNLSFRRAASAAIRAVRQFDYNAPVRERHLFSGAVPPLDRSTIDALKTSPNSRSAKQWKTASVTDMLLFEVRSADVFVITVPSVGGSIPKELKQWIEHVSLAAKATVGDRSDAGNPALHKIALLIFAEGASIPDFSSDSADSLSYRNIREQLRSIGVAQIIELRSGSHHIQLPHDVLKLISAHA